MASGRYIRLQKIIERASELLAKLRVQETFTHGVPTRPYQRDALGWFKFLQTMDLGGCLADDMGLGKTVMVLAFRFVLDCTALGANVTPSTVKSFRVLFVAILTLRVEV